MIFSNFLLIVFLYVGLSRFPIPRLSAPLFRTSPFRDSARPSSARLHSETQRTPLPHISIPHPAVFSGHSAPQLNAGLRPPYNARGIRNCAILNLYNILIKFFSYDAATYFFCTGRLFSNVSGAKTPPAEYIFITGRAAEPIYNLNLHTDKRIRDRKRQTRKPCQKDSYIRRRR